MLYVEYIARRSEIPWQIFRHHGRQDWIGEGDVVIANLGRTMKVGPEPHYMCWWNIRTIARMDEWEAHFLTPEGRRYGSESPVAHAMNFYRCGLYDALIEGEIATGKLHLVEFFDPAGRTQDNISRYFRGRADTFPDATLASVVTRVGLMGPDPGGLAVWSFDTYVTSERLVRSQSGHGAIPLVSAGYYRNFGEDIP